MEIITRKVGELQPNQRSAPELFPGYRQRGIERIILQVLDLDVVQAPVQDSRPVQMLEERAHVYDGLSDKEIDAIAKTRANLTRDFP